MFSRRLNSCSTSMVNMKIWRRPSSWKSGRDGRTGERNENVTHKGKSKCLWWLSQRKWMTVLPPFTILQLDSKWKDRIGDEVGNKPGKDACSCRETPCWGRCCWSYWSWRTHWAERSGWSRPVFAAAERVVGSHRSSVTRRVILEVKHEDHWSRPKKYIQILSKLWMSVWRTGKTT